MYRMVVDETNLHIAHTNLFTEIFINVLFSTCSCQTYFMRQNKKQKPSEGRYSKKKNDSLKSTRLNYNILFYSSVYFNRSMYIFLKCKN